MTTVQVFLWVIIRWIKSQTHLACVYTVICSFIIQWIHNAPFSGAQGAECCLKEREAPDRGFSLSYPQGTHSLTPHLIALLICSAAHILVCFFFRIYENCTVLLCYCPWMKSSSKQGKLLTWMKRRWLRLTYDVFLVVQSACYSN